MSREKDFFRDNLMRLDEKYPNTEFFNWTQAAQIVGLDARTLKKYYKRGREPYISKTRLASILS